jgi:hypothetical protein
VFLDFRISFLLAFRLFANKNSFFHFSPKKLGLNFVLIRTLLRPSDFFYLKKHPFFCNVLEVQFLFSTLGVQVTPPHAPGTTPNASATVHTYLQYLRATQSVSLIEVRALIVESAAGL